MTEQTKTASSGDDFRKIALEIEQSLDEIEKAATAGNAAKIVGGKKRKNKAKIETPSMAAQKNRSPLTKNMPSLK